MNLDVYTIAALVDEAMDTLVGGRIQDVLDTDAAGIGLEIYAHHRRQYLYLSADHQQPRVHLVGDRLRRGTERPTQLGLLMRRYVEGGVVTHASQPPWERIIQYDVEGPEGEVSIIVEPMERRSNILLVRDGVVLDCMRRVGRDENRFRVSLPNHPYQLPPPQQGKLDLFATTDDAFIHRWGANDDPRRKASQWLSALLLGISPLLAREILHRTGLPKDALAKDAPPEPILQEARALLGRLRQRDWQPGVAEEAGAALAYSVYPLTHLPGWQPTGSISEAMTRYYGAAVGAEAYDAAKEPVRQQLEEARTRLRAKLASLQNGLKDEAERDILQQSGELILAYQYTLKPGQAQLVAQYDPDGPPLTIALDPALTPLENAQRYFDRYNRAKRAQAGVPQLVEETERDLFYVAQLQIDLEQARNYPEIDDVAQALQERGWWQGGARARRGGARTGPMRLTKDGYLIWVGRNSLQNELVTFRHGNPQDLWLHARGVPGAHVVIRNDGRRIPDALIAQAAAVAAYYSASRAEQRAQVDVTRVKYVRKIKGAGPGMVTYRNEETLTVAPQSEEVLNG